MTTVRLRSVIMGIPCSLVGISVSVDVAKDAIGGGWQWFPLYAGVAAFITSSLLWWLLIEKPGRRGTDRIRNSRSGE